MTDKAKFYLPIAAILLCVMFFNVAEAAGYLEGYEEADPKPTGVSWLSTLAYLLSMFAVFAVVHVSRQAAAEFWKIYRWDRTALSALLKWPAECFCWA